MASKKSNNTSHQIAVAAEAYAAALFARTGCDVSVQYGANQPEYDLIAVKGDKLMKVSVKGSQDGSWGLTQSYLKKGSANYQGAIDTWLERHGSKTIFCLVQFKDVDLLDTPRVYLATPAEIAQRLKDTSKGKGDTILHEEKVWTKRAHGFGTTDRIPATWEMTHERVDELFDQC
jgi:Holliday junction resolvase-like predicted endonuclease